LEFVEKTIPLRHHFQNIKSTMKKVLAIFAVAAVFAACNNASETANAVDSTVSAAVDTATSTVGAAVDTAINKVDSAAGAAVDTAKAKAAEVIKEVKEEVKK
jgi:uncharacterized lipoprotein YajG